MSAEFRALRVFKTDDGQETRLVTLSEADHMDGDVDVRVEYSTLNYKDGLAMTGRAPVVRTWPQVAAPTRAATGANSGGACVPRKSARDSCR